MKRKIFGLIALTVCSVMLLCSCGTKWSVSNADNSAYVGGNANGGFVTETADYVYFINGVSSYTSDNTFGDVVLGSLMRKSKSKLADSSVSADIVVPKLMAGGDLTAGIYVWDGYVYYATPTTEKDKTGAIRNSDLDLCRTSLDGKKTEVIDRVTGNSTVYRFSKSGDGVYASYIYTDADSKTCFKTVDVKGKVKFDVHGIAEYKFGDSDDKYMFYVKTAYNDQLEQDEAFNDLYRYEFGKADSEKVMCGAGSARNDADFTAPSETFFLGVTYKLLAYTNGNLYYSYTNVESSQATEVTYKAVAVSGLTDKAFSDNIKAGDVISYGTDASAIFADKASYIVVDGHSYVVYIDSTYGAMAYDCDYGKGSYSKDGFDAFGKKILHQKSSLLKGMTVSSYKDGNLYLYDADGYFYRLNVADVLKGEDAKLERLTYIASTTSWYAPETVSDGSKDYILVSYNIDPFKNYVYFVEMTGEVKTKEEQSDLKDEWNKGDLETTEKIYATMLGKYSDSDKKVYDDKIAELSKNDAE